MIAAQNSRNRCLGNAKLLGYGAVAFASSIHARDGSGALWGDLGSPMSQPAWVPRTPLRFHVSHVVGLAAKEQMRRLHAESVVASVAHKGRPRVANKQHVCRSVGQHLAAHHGATAVALATVLGPGPDKTAALGALRLGKESSFGIIKAVPAVSSPVHAAHYTLNRKDAMGLSAGLDPWNDQLSSTATQPLGSKEVSR